MHADSGVLPRPEGHTVARKERPTQPSHQKPCHSERLYREESAVAGSSPAPAPNAFPDVEIIWKFCGKRRLTGFTPRRMLVKFRGQSVSPNSEIAWTEFAPLRRTAIRSLTTRLNVPVVRNGFGHKSERSHKIDHHGLQALSGFDLRIEIRGARS
jgi:hypothetical protein